MKKVIVALGLIAVLSIGYTGVSEAFFGMFGGHSAVTASNGVVEFSVKDHGPVAKYYQYNHNGKDIKFFIVASPDGVIRAAFDACDVCYEARKGYKQDGEFMICVNCGRRFHVSRINVVEGGCNPAPLNRVRKDGKITIAVSDIVAGARFF